jgi:hypothetical protein
MGAMSTFIVDPSQVESVAVVTTFSPRGYEVYGRRFIETFAKYWPDGPVRLFVYYEGRGTLLRISAGAAGIAKQDFLGSTRGKRETSFFGTSASFTRAGT